MNPFWLILGAFILFGIIGTIMNSAYEGKRTKTWQEVASQPGMQFLGENNDVLSRYGHLRLFQAGRNRRVKNSVQVDSGELRVVVGDYRYRTGSGKNSKTRHRTFCVLEGQMLDAPHCYLRPESRFFDAIGALFGGQDIDFDDDPAFSAAYVLQGEEGAIRQLFDADIRAWFAERSGQNFHFEAVGNTLVFHQGKRLPPNEAPDLMNQALQIMKLLARQS